MALYAGKTGAIAVDGKDVLHMGSWELSLSQDIHEVVSFGNRFKEKLPTILDWSATADGAADFETDSGQKELYDAWLSGDEIELKLALDEKTAFVGKAIVESLDVNTAADGAGEVSISLQGSNAVVLNLPGGEVGG